MCGQIWEVETLLLIVLESARDQLNFTRWHIVEEVSAASVLDEVDSVLSRIRQVIDLDVDHNLEFAIHWCDFLLDCDSEMIPHVKTEYLEVRCRKLCSRAGFLINLALRSNCLSKETFHCLSRRVKFEVSVF